jgi:hypothetical protein
LHSVVYMKDARETKITAILEKASNRAFVAGLTASLFSDWKDFMFTSRQETLICPDLLNAYRRAIYGY